MLTEILGVINLSGQLLMICQKRIRLSKCKHVARHDIIPVLALSMRCCTGCSFCLGYRERGCIVYSQKKRGRLLKVFIQNWWLCSFWLRTTTASCLLPAKREVTYGSSNKNIYQIGVNKTTTRYTTLYKMSMVVKCIILGHSSIVKIWYAV